MTERQKAAPAPQSSALAYAKQLGELMQTYAWWWIGPTIAGAVLAFAYMAVASPAWRATQTFQVRDDAGDFASIDKMKAYIEKIVGIAHHESVVAAAMKEVGPPEAVAEGIEWPTPREVQSTRETVSVKTGPESDLGRSPIVYLSADAASRDRAIALTNALTDQLEARLRQLKGDELQGIVSDCKEKAQLAKKELDHATKSLQAFEAEVGADLVELRVLEGGNGEGSLRGVLNKTKADLGQARARQATLEFQRINLAAMQADPAQLIATPSQLLESQPALKRLKDGLVDAQIREAELRGRMNDEHPQVIAAKENVQQVRQNLFAELSIAVRGIQTDQQVNQGVIKQLEKQIDEINARLDSLASKRAIYANLVADVKNRATILEAAQKALSDNEASRNAAASTRLLTRLDNDPTSGDRPLGPSKLMLLVGGTIGGLVAGLGLVFLVSSPALQQAGRRWTDFLYGRRSSDVPGGAPAAAIAPANAPPTRAAAPAPAPSAAPSPAPVAAAAPEGRRNEDRHHNPSQTLQASLASLASGTRQGRRATDPIAPAAVAAGPEEQWDVGDEDRRGGGDRRQEVARREEENR